MAGVDFNSAVTAGAAALAAAQVALMCRDAHRRDLTERLEPVLNDKFASLSAQFLRYDPLENKALRELGPWFCAIHNGAEVCPHHHCWTRTLPAARRHEAWQVMVRFKYLHALATPPIGSIRAARAIDLPGRLMLPHAFDRAYAALGIP